MTDCYPIPPGLRGARQGRAVLGRGRVAGHGRAGDGEPNGVAGEHALPSRDAATGVGIAVVLAGWTQAGGVAQRIWKLDADPKFLLVDPAAEEGGSVF
jgi:hypothetical protein